MASVTIKCDKKFNEFKAIFKDNKKACLIAVGEKWKKLATNIITSRNIIDTGTLKRTVDFRIADENTLEVGSPMEYAKYVEKQRKGGFLKDSVVSYTSVYKSIITKILKQGIK